MIIVNDGNISARMLKSISKVKMFQGIINTFRNNISARDVEGWITFLTQLDKRWRWNPSLQQKDCASQTSLQILYCDESQIRLRRRKY